MEVKHYTPVWKNKDGNRVIFAARNTFFRSYQAAHEWQLSQFLFMIPFGLTPDGILDFEAKSGVAKIIHVTAEFHPFLGEGCVISGPLFDAALPSHRPDPEAR
jgi:hypothetical protein